MVKPAETVQARQSSERPRSDAQIQHAVIQELMWDSRVDATDVGVEVDNGVVTLTGTVASYGKKVAAAEAAHRAFGVLDVANDIVVRIPGSVGHTDTELAQAVRRALEWNVLVPHDDIQSTVTDRWVTLTGAVQTLRQKKDAERAIRDLEGVRGISNDIQIAAAPHASYGELEQRIREAFERRADRAARRVRVYVDGARVTLRGSIPSVQEHDAILGAVSHAPGVREVIDELAVLGGPRATPRGWRNR